MEKQTGANVPQSRSNRCANF